MLQTISLHDQLRFESVDDSRITVSCNDANVPTDGRNLIVRAAEALRQRFNVHRGIHVQIEKNIPTQAGLGGASSNAAVALLALVKLWELNPSLSEIADIAATLGADVPFFISGGRVLATGTGTTIVPLEDIDRHHLIVVKPKANIPTVDAYAAYSSTRLTPKHTAATLSGSSDDANFADSEPCDVTDNLVNDFESVVFEMESEIGEVKQALLEAGARGALLAGSGSSVFGIFSTSEDQQRALEKITSEAGWRIFPCVTVSRADYVSALSLCGL